MKKIVLILLVIVSFEGFSQNWDIKKSIWTYLGTYHGSEAKIRISYASDTTVNGQDCHIFSKEFLRYNFPSKTYDHYKSTPEIMYHKDSITYILNENNFETLYNFKVVINDSFLVTNKYSLYDTTYALVKDTGSIFPLKWQAIEYHFYRMGRILFSYTDTVLERLGSTGHYYLPADFINGLTDGNEGGRLICYSDSNFINMVVGSGNCDFDISLGIAATTENTFELYPNPASNEVNFVSANHQNLESLEIYSAQGALVYKNNIPLAVQKINTSSWAPGLYYVQIKNDGGVVRKKIIISN